MQLRGIFLFSERDKLSFKLYVSTVDIDESKALIKHGGEVFGSVNKLAQQLTFSKTHVYRWLNSESRMSLKDYNKIKAIIKNESKRKESKKC